MNGPFCLCRDFYMYAKQKAGFVILRGTLTAVMCGIRECNMLHIIEGGEQVIYAFIVLWSHMFIAFTNDWQTLAL